MTESGVQLQPLKTASAAAEEEEDDVEDVPLDRGLLRPSKRIRIRHEEEEHKGEWLRACWLGLGLFLVLFSFWLLDSL